MKTYIFILTLLLLLNSCKKEEQQRMSVIDNDVQITVQDKDGVDLLNPSNPGTYLYENIKHYTLVNGVKTEVFHGNYDYPKNLYIHEYEGKYFMELFLDGPYAGNLGTDYIQWNENTVDTFKYEVTTAGDYYIAITKLWYNDSLVWTTADYSHEKGIRSLDITK